MLPHPTLDAPPPLRGSDPDSFAHHSVVNRLPDLLARTIQASALPEAALAHLRGLGEEIPDGLIRGIDDPEAPDAADWASYVAPFRSDDWLAVPWFFAETYFYRRIMEATGYFSVPCPGVDPFAPQKSLSPNDDASALSALAERLSLSSEDLQAAHGEPDPAGLEALLTTALWGNQADLSMWPGDDRPDAAAERSDDRILTDDRRRCAEWVCERAPLSRIDLIIDNTGFELLTDLALAAYLLDRRLANTVVLHAKSHPTFISDATTGDVRQVVDALADHDELPVRRLGKRLEDAGERRRLRVTDHFYWTSPRPGWGLPQDVFTLLADSDLLISKGDANYRRWLGDRHWAPTDGIHSILDYAPAPLLLLRTLKSEVVAGLTPAAVERAEDHDPDWQISGESAVVQFIDRPSTPLFPEDA